MITETVTFLWCHLHMIFITFTSFHLTKVMYRQVTRMLRNYNRILNNLVLRISRSEHKKLKTLTWGVSEALLSQGRGVLAAGVPGGWLTGVPGPGSWVRGVAGLSHGRADEVVFSQGIDLLGMSSSANRLSSERLRCGVSDCPLPLEILIDV